MLASLLLVALVGSGSVARITMRDSSSVEGEIVASSNHYVSVETDEGDEDVPRQEIRDIDHPGNVAATIGGILMGFGALNIAVGFSQCDKRGVAFCIGVMTPEVFGLGLFVYGFKIWRTSVINSRPAGPGGRLALRMRVAPMLLMAGETRTGGLQLAAEF